MKQVIPPGGSIADAAPAGGFTFGATAANGITVTPPSGVTANVSGALNFNLTFPGTAPTGTATITETQRPGYTLQPVNGANAACINVATGTALPVNDTSPLGFSVGVATAYPVSCTVYDRAPTPSASVVVRKLWTVNGVSVPEGDQDPRLVADLTIDGTAADWGDPRTGFALGDTPVIDETVGFPLAPLCTLDSGRITEANNAPVDAALPYSPTLAAGENAYVITNTVTCRSRLTLVKSVLGPADPSLWNLAATGPAGSLPGPNGQTGMPGATAEVTPNVQYALAESGGDPRYVQLDVSVPTERVAGSTGSWVCQEVNPVTRTIVRGFQDGLQGGVVVPAGSEVHCTAVNATASLTLAKVVDGPATPSGWMLVATPVEPPAVPMGLTPVSVAGSAAGASVQLRPGQSYALSETGGPPGYAASAWTCSGVATQQGNIITVAAQGEATCRITNTAIAPRLTLVKTVDNGTTGGAAAPSAWTLTAVNGPSVITGPGGSAEITDQVAVVGTYTLAESGGPSGYTASAWQCTGGSSATSTTITLALADVATCTITNTAVAPTLSLVKQVHNLNGGTAAASDWTLRAAGPVTIAGATGTDAVTRASIRAGSYTLSEAGGPADYIASAWSCGGATVSGNMVEVPLGANVVCLIVNTDPQPPIPPVPPNPPVPPYTGGPSPWLTWGGLIMLAAGGTLTWAARRRRIV